MARILLKNGRIIDPGCREDAVRDLLIEDGWIVESFSGEADVEVIEATGRLVVPGLIDMHVHLREPGREDEETIESGARAAALGGFTAVACMPNTSPAIDSRAIVDFIKEKASGCPVDVLPIGAVSAGLRGEGLSDMAELAAAGVAGFSDDGRPVSDSRLMRGALELSTMLGLPIISHAEDLALAADGVMNEGPVATKLGLRGIPGAAEEVMTARDIILAEKTGGRLHLTHVSTAFAVELIRAAKARGIKVTADCTPHHLALTDERLAGYDANFKMNPPLRSEVDRLALVEGLFDGTIDAIASDHAPHAIHEKDTELERAAFGAIGLQTTVPVVFSHLKLTDKTLPVLIAALTTGPARILGREASLAVGSTADVTIIDTKARVEVDTSYFVSKSVNSAFIGESLAGAAGHVIKNGRLIVREGAMVQ